MATLRDPRQSADKYEERLAVRAPEVDVYRDLLVSAVNDGFAPGAANIKASLRAATQALTLRYALGQPMTDLTDSVQALGDLWGELYGAVGDRWQERDWARSSTDVARNAEFAMMAVQTASWGVALGRTDVVQHVLSAYEVAAARLPVLGHLARFVGLEAPVDGKPSHAKLWGPWIAVVEAGDDDRAEAFRQFVTSYPAGLKAVGRRIAPSNDGYLGQFAFEAAPLAIHFDIDDSSVRDFPDYPTDLVDYGRSLR